MPSAFAVLKFIDSSICVGCSTGRSAGRAMSGLPPKVDICIAVAHVRKVPKVDIREWPAGIQGLVIESSMGAPLHRVLPVLAVKIVRLQQREVNIIDAACIDVDLVRVRTRHVERMDAAVLQNVCLATPLLNV